MNQPRIGFCCKYVPQDGNSEVARAFNVTTVTMSYLARLAPKAAYDKLAFIVAHNLKAFRHQIEYVASRPQRERLHRLSSGLLPGYTYPSCEAFYKDQDLRRMIESSLAEMGDFARARGVRLSMHPGQFCVIASNSESALRNGIAEFEYHAEIMTLMGYGSAWHQDGAHINIHGGARAVGAEGLRQGLSRLSQQARNLVTFENDEVSYGLDDLLPLSDTVPLVLDIHHHWIQSCGEYIEPDDPRIARVIASWRGVRPLSHVSVSREEYIPNIETNVRPNFRALLESGVKAKDLRAHSDLLWNEAINELVAQHLAWTDFEVEAKLKNLASEGLAHSLERLEQARQNPKEAVFL